MEKKSQPTVCRLISKGYDQLAGDGVEQHAADSRAGGCDAYGGSLAHVEPVVHNHADRNHAGQRRADADTQSQDIK